MPRILAKVSGLPISEEMLRDDVIPGSADPDGTLDLVHYVAWLVKENGSWRLIPASLSRGDLTRLVNSTPLG